MLTLRGEQLTQPRSIYPAADEEESRNIIMLEVESSLLGGTVRDHGKPTPVVATWLVEGKHSHSPLGKGRARVPPSLHVCFCSFLLPLLSFFFLFFSIDYRAVLIHRRGFEQ